MTHVGFQHRQQRADVLSLGEPEPQVVNRESMAQIVLLSGAENAYGFGLSAALVVPMGSAGEAGW